MAGGKWVGTDFIHAITARFLVSEHLPRLFDGVVIEPTL